MLIFVLNLFVIWVTLSFLQFWLVSKELSLQSGKPHRGIVFKQVIAFAVLATIFISTLSMVNHGDTAYTTAFNSLNLGISAFSMANAISMVRRGWRKCMFDFKLNILALFVKYHCSKHKNI